MTRNRHLPLTETTTYILLALTQPLHGYGAIQKITELSDGAVKVAAGTMYGAIENLLKLGWIHEVPSADKRRRVYEVTAQGQDILRQEIQRLRQLGNLATQLGY
ncbi:transcriptional regulator [Levilactobacillus zymae]|uniref:Transcriptional regulator n=1 Tax=Levilactobacillus zymae TaxID=267363 RepID=A0ABQ0WX17_9LACO|nr:helix-turn-helix transcriptional regulator [Levilactobacillus zymae]QFR62305.1 PadR family transcriptional regulator [Levilactobacillus zymae]GEO71972.1 transcriptional regulator [Levilactobacillus zymae]